MSLAPVRVSLHTADNYAVFPFFFDSSNFYHFLTTLDSIPVFW